MPRTDSHRHDIQIGEDAWIAHLDVSGREHTAVPIDDALHRASGLWNALETLCDAGCCGVDAFDFAPDSVRQAAATLDRRQLAAALHAMHQTIEALPVSVVVSQRLNFVGDKRTVLALLAHLHRHVQPT